MIVGTYRKQMYVRLLQYDHRRVVPSKTKGIVYLNIPDKYLLSIDRDVPGLARLGPPLLGIIR